MAQLRNNRDRTITVSLSLVKMKRQHYTLFLTTTLATILFGLTATRLLAETISVSGGLSNPITTQGQSGGNVNSNDCGFIPSTPQEVINVTQRMNYLRVSVDSAGNNSTLLVDGPNGRFCILADSGSQPSLSGVWMPGEYKIYVGDQQGESHQYTLRLSTQQ